MSTSINQGGWKTSTAVSVKTSSGWKQAASYVKTSGGLWKPLDQLPNIRRIVVRGVVDK